MIILIKKLKMFFALSGLLILFGCGDISNNDSNANNVSSVDLNWDPPTTNMNGTTLANLAGYKVYMGTTTSDLTLLSDVGNTTTYTVTNLPAGTTVYFAVTAYDSTGNESDLSNLVS
jgi:fibronectin type 3 domain-containing protein